LAAPLARPSWPRWALPLNRVLINQTIELAPTLLLRGGGEVPLIKGMIGAVWGMYRHANLGVRTGRLKYVINGPEADRWHHAVDPDAEDLAATLAFWDDLFGTAWIPPRKGPAAYGLAGQDFPVFPPARLFFPPPRTRARGGRAERLLQTACL
jgi:sterol desaturase/sphingolipid hydroxylase (fatty acid hydroxylase superfamily)